MKSSVKPTPPSSETLAHNETVVRNQPSQDRPEPAAKSDVVPEPVPSGCPTPLSHATVIKEFFEQSVPWSLDCGGRSLSGRTWGTGPVVYFLNGVGGTHRLFAPVVWLLRKSFRCVVFDYPGDNSARTRLTVEHLVDDLLTIADAQGDQTFACYGASLGGLVTLAAMKRSPERITRAMIQNGFASRRLTRFERLLIRMGRRWPGSLDHVPGYRSLLRQNHARWFPRFDSGRWQFFAQDSGEVRVAELAERAAVVRDTNLRSILAEITRPIVLIGTEGEGRVNRHCREELAQALPNATVEMLPDSGQLPCLTQPHRMAKLITSFLLDESNPETPS